MRWSDCIQIDTLITLNLAEDDLLDAALSSIDETFFNFCGVSEFLQAGLDSGGAKGQGGAQRESPEQESPAILAMLRQGAKDPFNG